MSVAARITPFSRLPPVALRSATGAKAANFASSRQQCRRQRNNRDQSLKGCSQRGAPGSVHRIVKREKGHPPPPFFIGQRRLVALFTEQSSSSPETETRTLHRSVRGGEGDD